MVNIYYLKLDNFKIDDHFEKVFSDVRMEKLKQITNEEVRLERIAAEVLLQYAFKEYGFDIPKEYAYDNLGKPTASDVYFSITHTKGAVMVAVSNNPVGVDLEMRRNIDEKIASRILTKEELDFYNEHKGSEYLLDCFVRKESFFKMTGEGIGSNLTKESIEDILNSSKQVALCFDDYLSIITTYQKDLYDVTKVNYDDLLKLCREVENE